MISDIAFIVGLTALAGICIPVGGLLARVERIGPNWLEQEFRHFLIALGGGILLGAVTIVLIPEGQSSIGGSFWAIPAIIAGGVLFFWIERMLGVHHNESPQLMGVMLDFVPEAAALGGLIVINPGLAPLMAVLIAMQNLPEGFNAYREFCNKPGYTPKKTLLVMAGLATAGPIAGLLGYFFLSGQPVILAEFCI